MIDNNKMDGKMFVRLTGWPEVVQRHPGLKE